MSVGIDQLDITTVTATTAGKRFSNEIIILFLLFLTFLGGLSNSKVLNLES